MKGMQSAVTFRYPRRNILAVGLLLLFTGLAFLALFKLVTLDSTNDQTSSYVTITGNPVCLPHKGNGPHTLECAIGLKGDDGRYYALVNVPDNLVFSDFSSRVKVQGILTEPSSSNQYDISGSLTVSSAAKQ